MTTTEAFAKFSFPHGFNHSTINSPAILEPDIHWGKTTHLAEDHLLTSLGSNGLGQKLANFTRIEMIDETPNTGLPEASQARHKVEPFTNGAIWIIVDTLLGCSLSEHVGQEGGVSGFLVGHEFDERHVLSIETRLEELSFGEAGEAVVEEVQFNPFLQRMSAKFEKTKHEVIVPGTSPTRSTRSRSRY